MPSKAPSLKTVAPGIYQRPTGKYVVPIYDPSSGQKRYSHPDVPRGGFDDLKDAKAFKKRMDAEKAEQGSQAETCASFAKRWTRDYPRPSSSTNEHNAERVKAFVKDFGDRPLGDVTRAEARLWIHGGIAPKGVQATARKWEGAKRTKDGIEVPPHVNNHGAIRAMFNDAVDTELISRNPFSALRLKGRRGRSDIIVFEPHELDRLVLTAEHVWGDFGKSMIGPWLILAAHTGMRPSELFAMRWDWIDFDAEVIEVRGSTDSQSRKTEAARRTILLLPEARAALERIPRVEGHDQVLYIQRGGPFTQRQAHYYFSPVRTAFWSWLHDNHPHRADEIPRDFDLYELRHYFGTYLANLGVLPYDIADQMGHADGGALAMARYIHTRSQDARDRIRARLAEASEPGSGGMLRRQAG